MCKALETLKIEGGTHLTLQNPMNWKKEADLSM